MHWLATNDITKPDVTGTGHRPMGFDEMMAQYNHYTVIGFKVRATFINTSDANEAFVGVFFNDANALTTSIDGLIESGRMKYKTIGNNSSSRNMMVIHRAQNPTKFLSSSAPLSDLRLKGTATTGPTEKVYCVLTVFPYDGTVDLGAFQVNFECEYIVVFHESGQLEQSVIP